MKSDKLLIIATVIMLFMGVVMYYQNKTMNKMRDLLEKVDTTTITTTDTLYLDKYIVDSVPKYVTEYTVKTDTVYQKEGDSISAQPMFITLKKKKSPTLMPIQPIQ